MTQIPSEDLEYLPVADFYAGKSVFITGATGFLGKAYVEKLAYTCDQIEKIYILIRDKKGMNIEQRMEKYFDLPIFSRIKQERPEALNKIIPIYGDIAAPNLGIKPEDCQELIEKVSIVIHSAATIKFNEPLKIALNVNVEGTRRMLNFAKRMKNIPVFVYVSTAYSNTSRKVVEEVLYPPPADLSEVQKLAERHHILGGDNEEIKKILRSQPNTYTFSKAIAENLVAENHGDMPTIIIRPSIISATAKEPVEGWVNNWFGATGLLTFAVRGWNHVLLASGSVVLDMIPLDYVANLTLVAVARCKSSKEVIIYNSCSSWANPITFRELHIILKQYSLEHKMSNSVFVLLTKHKAVVEILRFLMQTSPAFMADISRRITGKQAKYVRLQSMISMACEATEYFTTHSWVIQCGRARALYASLSARDRQLFPCDPACIDWPEYIYTYMSGVTKYLLKNE